MTSRKDRSYYENSTKKLTLASMLTAAALILSYIEMLLPLPIPILGVKLGLANGLVVIALYYLGTSYAYYVNIARVLLSGLLFGNMFSLLYSLAGGLFSLTVMTLLKKTGLFSITGVSMTGGVFHNLAQLLVAALIINSSVIFYYFPFLLISGMICGIFIGVTAHFACLKLKSVKH